MLHNLKLSFLSQGGPQLLGKLQMADSKFPTYCYVRKLVVGDSQNIVTHMTIARQLLGKNIPEVSLSTMERYPLLGNKPMNTWL
jgi:hypothetical protein